MKSTKLKANIFLALTYIILIAVCIFVLIPIIYVVSLSFSSGRTIHMDSLLPRNPTLNNYQELIQGTHFLKWYGNTIAAGLFTAVVTLILVTPTAYAFSRLRFRGRRQGLMLLLVLQMFPGMMAMVAYYVLLNLLGLLNTLLGVTLLYAGAATTLYTWLLKGFFDSVPKSIEEAALIDGASRITVFFKIILPLSTSMLVLVTVFAFAAPFGDFVLSRIVLSRPEDFTLALGTYKLISGEFGNNFPMFAASSVLASLPITILYLALQKVMVTSFKGAVVR